MEAGKGGGTQEHQNPRTTTLHAPTTEQSTDTPGTGEEIEHATMGVITEWHRETKYLIDYLRKADTYLTVKTEGYEIQLEARNIWNTPCKLDKLVRHKNPILQLLETINLHANLVSKTTKQLISTLQRAPVNSTFIKQWQCSQATKAQTALFESIRDLKSWAAEDNSSQEKYHGPYAEPQLDPTGPNFEISLPANPGHPPIPCWKQVIAETQTQHTMHTMRGEPDTT